MSVDLSDCIVCGVVACEVKHRPDLHCVFVYQGRKKAGNRPKITVCHHQEKDHCAYSFDACASMHPRPCGGKSVHHPYHRYRQAPPLDSSKATD